MVVATSDAAAHAGINSDAVLGVHAFGVHRSRKARAFAARSARCASFSSRVRNLSTTRVPLRVRFRYFPPPTVYVPWLIIILLAQVELAQLSAAQSHLAAPRPQHSKVLVLF